MKTFGVQSSSDFNCTRFSVLPQKYIPASITIEGDWSSASYLVSAGALNGELTVTSLDPLSLQADKVIISILQKMGASIQVDKDSVATRSSRLFGLEHDMSNCIDLLPTAAVLASMAEGTSKFTGIARARLKESNRVTALKDGFRLMGIDTREQEDVLEITGRIALSACIDANNDHRIAMAFALAGLKNGGIVIDGAECVSKTYPDYWQALQNLGGKVRLHDE
jgi:3-phosphoshikimate 1-carboxyvinyltransferase